MYNNIKIRSVSYFKKLVASALLIIGVSIISAIFTSCEIDDDIASSGSIGGSTTNSKKFVGSWTRQVQWAYTDGTREDTYTFSSGGSGSIKMWDWTDQKYVYRPISWSAYGDYIEYYGSDDIGTYSGSGYINSSGSAIKINDSWYYKK